MGTSTTTNYHLIKPNEFEEDDLWGGELNTNFDSIDALIKTSTDLGSGALRELDAVYVLTSVAGFTDPLGPATFTGDQIQTEGYYNHFTAGLYADNKARGHALYTITTDTVEAPNAVTIFADTAGSHWRLSHHGSVFLSQCGAKLDGVADDLAAFNRGIALLNDPNSQVFEIIVDGNAILSAEPDPLTKAYRTIRGLGRNVTRLIFPSTATGATTFITIGSVAVANAAQCCVVRDLGFEYQNTPNPAKAAIKFARSTRSQLLCCYFTKACMVTMHGGDGFSGTVYEKSVQDEVSFCSGNIILQDNSKVHMFKGSTGSVYTSNYFGGVGTGITNARVLLFQPSATAPGGCDDDHFVNNTWNFNASDIDHGVEFDSTNPGVTNSRFTGNTLDGGLVSSVKLKIGNAGVANSRITNIRFTGNRMSASTTHVSRGGGCVLVEQSADVAISSVLFTGNKLSGGVRHSYYRHTRSGGAPVTMLDMAFTGNDFVVDYGKANMRCAVATTANITLSGIQTIDTVAGAANMITLVKDQSAPAQNGVYRMQAGAWTRYAGMDEIQADETYDGWDREVPGARYVVTGGSVNLNTHWKCTSAAGGTYGTTAITWASFNPLVTDEGTDASVFEVNSEGLTVTGNSVVGIGDLLTSPVVGSPWFVWLADLKVSTGRRHTFVGNSIKGFTKPYPVNVAILAVQEMAIGPKILGNSGTFDNPNRQISTTDNVVTTIAQQALMDSYNYRVACEIQAYYASGASGASFRVSGLIKCVAGVATILWQETVTDFETDAGLDANLAVASNNISIRVQGKAATNIDWSVSNIRLNVR